MLGAFRLLFRQTAQAASGSSTSSISSSRKLYTRAIYPYPFNHMNEKVYPSQNMYRETVPPPKWEGETLRFTWRLRIFFWTYLWWSLYNDPHALIGHHSYPDPSLWTDEELGIPPLSEGSYYEWLDNKRQESEA